MERSRRDRRALAASALAPREAGPGRRALPVDRRRRVGDAWPARRARGARRDRRRAPHRPRARAPRRRARRARTRAAYRDVARPGGPGALARDRGPAGGRARSAHRGPAELAAPDAHGRDRPRGPGRAARADPRSDRRDRVRGRPRRRARRRARGASRGPRRDRGVWPADHRVDRTTTRGGADMIRSFRRFWRYLTAALEGTLDELLDPRVQIEQAIGAAKLQERMADAVRQVTSFAPPGDTPALATVGERIDRRFARATARGELAADALDARMLDVSRASLDIEAERRLAEIRAAMAAEDGT